MTLYRVFNMDPAERLGPTLYRGELEGIVDAVKSLIRIRDRWPHLAVWIEPMEVPRC